MALHNYELFKRATDNFGELLATMAIHSPDANLIRQPNAIGMKVGQLGRYSYMDAAVVPIDQTPPPHCPNLPHYLWSHANEVDGRAWDNNMVLLGMGLDLKDFKAPQFVFPYQLIESGLETVGQMNECVYPNFSWFSQMITCLEDGRVATYGFKLGPNFVCVALTLLVDENLSIHAVTTANANRKQGLASQLVSQILAKAKDEGVRSATLHATQDGLALWEKLGFKKVGDLKGYVG